MGTFSDLKEPSQTYSNLAIVQFAPPPSYYWVGPQWEIRTPAPYSERGGGGALKKHFLGGIGMHAVGFRGLQRGWKGEK